MQYPASPPPESAVFKRFLFILYFTLFATVGLYWVVLEMLAPGVEPADMGMMKKGLGAAAAVCAAVVLYLRFGQIATLLADTTGELSSRLARLRLYYIISYTLSEAVALYGFALRMIGADRADAVPFFLGAVALFLLCYPRMPGSPPG